MRTEREGKGNEQNILRKVLLREDYRGCYKEGAFGELKQEGHSSHAFRDCPTGMFFPSSERSMGKRGETGNSKMRWAKPREEAIGLLKALRDMAWGPQEEMKVKMGKAGGSKGEEEGLVRAGTTQAKARRQRTC